ncbi:TIGR01777 family oxidoreductase [Testudinibacter sp. TR-2022]|uniref:TIGR01777 family oxidoreductase n=1 Tax=Testudinibacter sp. TR-2022 TaxID=2585029 RepID=UPI00111A0979|nr:TIGR01777 family oxidoreductase [Testudinibacter sp. TR-2022]TNH04719.1 TIGR01777 family protein [Pasteurellaceae bacterium Phil11]TNH22259.1 TIGR01777 family protein [Testudinibacter sp. TR-2022]TNH22776.1 TIGR01777 family protein [Testudinibacter sp. TR-2022]
MKIFITGGTGLIGQVLTRSLLSQGHQLTLLSRNPAQARTKFPDLDLEFVPTLNSYSSFDQYDAVINLAGEPIFDKAWHDEQKKQLIDSRIKITERLVELINAGKTPPHSFISGSAVGYYGDNGESAVSEDNPKGDQFPAQLCYQWEQAALQANSRTCLLRTANVLSTHGGALAKMLPLYKCGLGGKLGSGKQYWAWIHRQDMVAAIEFLLNHPTCQGAFNLCSPNPVRNNEFNRTLANTLRRPHFAFVPAFMLKLVFGERAQLLLDSQNILPCRLIKAGFEFHFDKLADALHDCIKNKS